MKKKILKLTFVIAALLLSVVTFAQRDPLKWPFAKTSIWNMPLHNNALYRPGNIGAAVSWGMTEDEDVIIMTPSSPLINVRTNSWTNRCPSGTPALLTTLPVPSDLIVNNGGTPNFAAGILQPDGRTIYQTQPFQKCVAGTTAFSQYVFATSDIYGDGRLGAHGGSGLSSIGGTIRVGELLPNASIKHALKINLYANKYVFYSAATGGYRWPASQADSYAASNYSTTCPNYMRMGALLALLPAFNINILQTEPAKIIARALQTYGGYVVDDTAWDVYAIETETGPAGNVMTEFKAAYGYDYNVNSLTHPFAVDMATIFKALQCVDNNDANNIGGGPTTDTVNRRAPMAPGFTSAIAPTSVSVSPTTGSMQVGSTLGLTSAITPSNATNQTVSWSTNNGSVATVSSAGLVTAIGAGTAIITVTTQDGSKTATSAITVTVPASSNIALNKVASMSCGWNPEYANDGNQTTRWVACNGTFPKSWSVDLGANANVTRSEVDWEFNNRVYKYRIEVSANNSSWTTVVNKTANNVAGNMGNNFTASSVRYLRITITGAPNGVWASIREFRVIGTFTGARSATPSNTIISSAQISAYPNPLINGDLKIDIDGFEKISETNITIHDALGRVIMRRNIYTNKYGSINLTISKQQILAKGLITVSANSGNNKKSIKVFIQ